MAFQSDAERIVWWLHLAASLGTGYSAIDSDAGRAAFWAEGYADR